MTKYKKFLGLILAVGVSLAIFIFRDKLTGLEDLGYFGLFILNIIGSATLLLPTPLFLTAFALGAIYNPIIVAIVASLGSSIGELTGYAAGRGAEDFVNNDKKIKKVKGWMDKYGLWTLFVLAAIPNPLFDLAGIVAGATGIPIYKYLIVVWLGKLLKFGVLAESANIIIR